jgi:hypothetical protein
MEEREWGEREEREQKKERKGRERERKEREKREREKREKVCVCWYFTCIILETDIVKGRRSEGAASSEQRAASCEGAASSEQRVTLSRLDT